MTVKDFVAFFFFCSLFSLCHAVLVEYVVMGAIMVLSIVCVQTEICVYVGWRVRARNLLFTPLNWYQLYGHIIWSIHTY